MRSLHSRRPREGQLRLFRRIVSGALRGDRDHYPFWLATAVLRATDGAEGELPSLLPALPPLPPLRAPEVKSPVAPDNSSSHLRPSELRFQNQPLPLPQSNSIPSPSPRFPPASPAQATTPLLSPSHVPPGYQRRILFLSTTSVSLGSTKAPPISNLSTRPFSPISTRNTSSFTLPTSEWPVLLRQQHAHEMDPSGEFRVPNGYTVSFLKHLLLLPGYPSALPEPL